MYDSFDRKISYLRISVTDRCNLRCRYCMPAEGIQMMDHNDILSFEEISAVVEKLVPMGINKIHFTGGEPLVRKGIEKLIGMVSGISGIEDIGLTTNGILLEEKAPGLAANGLKRVNVSLDTIDPDKYRRITRGGNIVQVFKGIEMAQSVGFNPIKINCVKTSETSEKELKALKIFCSKRNLALRYIRQMDLASGRFEQIEGSDRGNCELCNRIRLTAKGNFKPCLFSEFEYNIRELGVIDAFKRALANKPERGMSNTRNEFYNIGG